VNKEKYCIFAIDKTTTRIQSNMNARLSGGERNKVGC
jgi:hypothetical protein